MESKNLQLVSLYYRAPRRENLSLLKTTPELHYNREIISLKEFLNFDKFDMGYLIAESHLCHRICVTEGQLFTKLECLLYHKVNLYNNRLKNTQIIQVTQILRVNNYKQFLTKPQPTVDFEVVEGSCLS